MQDGESQNGGAKGLGLVVGAGSGGDHKNDELLVRDTNAMAHLQVQKDIEAARGVLAATCRSSEQLAKELERRVASLEQALTPKAADDTLAFAFQELLSAGDGQTQAALQAHLMQVYQQPAYGRTRLAPDESAHTKALNQLRNQLDDQADEIDRLATALTEDRSYYVSCLERQEVECNRLRAALAAASATENAAESSPAPPAVPAAPAGPDAFTPQSNDAKLSSQLQGQLDSTVQELTVCQATNEALRATMQDIQKQLTEQQVATATAERNADEMEQHIKALNLAAAAHTMADAKAEEAAAQTRAVRRECDTLSDQNKKLQTRLNSLEGERDDAISATAKLRAEFERQNQERAADQRVISDLRDQIAQLRREAARMEAANQVKMVPLPATGASRAVTGAGAESRPGGGARAGADATRAIETRAVVGAGAGTQAGAATTQPSGMFRPAEARLQLAGSQSSDQQPGSEWKTQQQRSRHLTYTDMPVHRHLRNGHEKAAEYVLSNLKATLSKAEVPDDVVVATCAELADLARTDSASVVHECWDAHALRRHLEEKHGYSAPSAVAAALQQDMLFSRVQHIVMESAEASRKMAAATDNSARTSDLQMPDHFLRDGTTVWVQLKGWRKAHRCRIINAWPNETYDVKFSDGKVAKRISRAKIHLSKP